MNKKIYRYSFTTIIAGVLAVLALFSAAPCSAEKPIKGKFKSSLTGYTLIAIADNGKSTSKAITGTSFSINPPGNKVALALVDSASQYYGPVVVPKCTQKGVNTKCKTDRVYTGIKAGANLGTITVRNNFGLASIKKFSDYKKAIVSSRSVAATAGKPSGAGSLGQPSDSDQGISAKRREKIKADPTNPDADGDGVPTAYDVDDDNDGIIDNYDDQDGSGGTPPSSSFVLFSNLKLDIDQSLNLNASGSLPQSAIDAALQNAQTLAIAVAGSPSDTVELNCGALSYCSIDGTGTPVEGNSPFPGTTADHATYDSDNDGYGTITRGSTGDFQLRTRATSTEIAAGDVLSEIVTSGGTATEIPGMLNFVFNSTPAVKSITASAGGTTLTPETVDYSVTGTRKGSRQNCFQAPATGDVTLAITAWRPQRPGNSAAGEGTFVDIGNSLLTIDIPNGACASPNGSCAAQGPGNCSSGSYSTADTSLTVGANGIEDNRGDVDSSTSNTLTFSINLGTCLSSAAGGAVSWTAGQTLFLDLQARSQDGDNAAQKFCVTRAAS